MTQPYLPHPKDWNVSTLEPKKNSNVIIKVTSGGTPSTKIEDYWDGDIPWLTPKEITQDKTGTFISKTERFLTQKGLNKSGAKLMQEGTVMLTKRAPVGAVVVNVVPMATNQGFLNFRCGNDLDSIFLCYWLKANKPYLDVIANGSTYPELYLNDLFEFQIAYPSIEEQEKIVKILLSIELAANLGEILESTIGDLLEILVSQNETRELNRIKGRILLYLMSGKIRVNNLG